MNDDWTDLLQADLAQLTRVVETRSVVTELLLPGERREVAILFLDLKGFTALSETLDHEVVHRVVTGVMQALARVVTGFGGYVDKYEGDLIMALFGAQQASENDASRAVACARKMLDTLLEVNSILRLKSIDLSARIGVNYGPVTVAPDPSGHLTVIGDEVNLASRLESTAEVGTIQVSEQVFRKCESHFIWQDLGRITVKGKREPVHTYRPVGIGSGVLKRWERSARIARSPLIGRDREIAELKSLWQHTIEKTSLSRRGIAKHRLIFIEGEAGIGKSRLLNDFLQQSLPENYELLKGSTREYAQPAYWSWIVLLRNRFGIIAGDEEQNQRFLQTYDLLISSLDSDSLQESLLRTRPFILHLLLPEYPQPDFKQYDDRTVYRESMIAIRNTLLALATQKPLAIWLEDGHWLDAASRETLEFILANFEAPHPLIVFCAQRPDRELTGFFQIDDDQVEVNTVTLPALNETSCEDLLHAILDREAKHIAPDVTQYLLRYAQGNPLFLEELILDGIESGKLEVEKDEWKHHNNTATSVPSSIGGLVRSRIDRLPQEWRHALQIAAVFGFEFSAEDFCTVTRSIDRKLPEDILDELCRIGFLIRLDGVIPGFTFQHILVRNAAYDTLLHHNRTILHRHVAERLQARPVADAIAGLMAHHWELANDRDQATVWHLRALRENERSYQYREGMERAEKLLEWLRPHENEETKADLIFETLRLYRKMYTLTGDTKRELETIDQMLQLCERWQWRTRRADVLDALGNVVDMMGDSAKAQQYFEEALAIFREENVSTGIASALNNLGTQSLLKRKYLEAEPYLTEALEWIRLNNDRRRAARVLCNLAVIRKQVNDIAVARSYYEEALAMSRELCDRKNEAVVLVNIGNLHYIEDRMDEVTHYYRAALAIQRDIGNRPYAATTLNNLGYIYFENGSYDEAEEAFRESLELNRDTHNRRGEVYVLLNLCNLLMDTNRVSEGYAIGCDAFRIASQYQLHQSSFEQIDVVVSKLISAGYDPLPLPDHWHITPAEEL